MTFSFQHLQQPNQFLNRLSEWFTTFIPLLMQLKVADIHLDFIHLDIQILLRYQGVLMTLEEFIEKNEHLELLRTLATFKPTDNTNESKILNDIPHDFAWFDNTTGVRLRINHSIANDATNINSQGIKYVWVMRIIQTNILALSDIGLGNKTTVIQNWLEKPQGLILITGATGSGKSTTLSAMIQYLSTKKINIITLEDPIETVYPPKSALFPAKITQVELNTHVNSFADGLKSSLRQDPDVILVGELRDLETMKTALTLAETGHLVLSTLHTRSSSQSINRLIQAFPASEQQLMAQLLADNLIGIISQRLHWSETAQKQHACFEILENIPAISHLIREQQLHQIISFMQTHQNMQTMEQAQQQSYLQ